MSMLVSFVTPAEMNEMKGTTPHKSLKTDTQTEFKMEQIPVI